MPPESARYVRDMLDAVQTIELHVLGKTGDDYRQLRWLRDAVTWNFCVIGEALSQLLKIEETTGRRITESHKIVGLRNQLIHGYGVIDHDITWKIVAEKLPILHRELEELLAT